MKKPSDLHERAKDIRQELMMVAFENDGEVVLPAGHLAIFEKHLAAIRAEAKVEGWKNAEEALYAQGEYAANSWLRRNRPTEQED